MHLRLKFVAGTGNFVLKATSGRFDDPGCFLLGSYRFCKSVNDLCLLELVPVTDFTRNPIPLLMLVFPAKAGNTSF
jgi:hypothetical protein